MVIENTAVDSRFRMHAQVVGEPRIRFFAGAPVVLTGGLPVGVLCAIDVVPRVLTSEQEEAMELLARQLQARLELRRERALREEFVRESERAASSLRASEELFRAFMNASPFLSYIKDAAGRLLFYNRSFARRFGVSEFAWLGRTDEQLWAANMAAPMRERELEVMAGGHMVESEERIRAADGTVSSWRTFKFPCHDSAGNTLLAAVAVDISEEVLRKAEIERYQVEMEEANEQLRQLAVTDELTGLRNRRAFEERLVLEFSMSRRRKRDLSVLLLDVDDFKRINDQWGHPAGDAVLRRLGAVLRTTVRLPDLVARYGGEEFVVLLPESDAESALSLAQRLMERVAAESWDHDPVTISVGLAGMHESLTNGYQLVGRADQALYAAKRAGKNRAVIFRGDALS
jgi:diguanylate cyclase (GGDEF)-like protein/PAS domain S-box-containing protein